MTAKPHPFYHRESRPVFTFRPSPIGMRTRLEVYRERARIVSLGEMNTIPSLTIAIEGLATMREQIKSARPDWSAALNIWDEIDYATLPLFDPYEPGQSIPMVDSRIGEMRTDVERLKKALESKDRILAENLLISTTRRLQALVETAVA